jgi:phosphatidylserine/phosphatidylglycerophosphate/cardiolipin synthase-like enzyme
MHQLLRRRAEAGVDVRVIGETRNLQSPLPVEKYPGRRLHVRTIIRDGQQAFVGSQSLHPLALEGRREVGVIVSDAAVVKELQSIFERDWRLTGHRVN